jgi:hypothetical protein
MKELDVASVGGNLYHTGRSGYGQEDCAGAQPGARHDQRRKDLVTSGRREQEVGREADGLQQAPHDPDRAYP